MRWNWLALACFIGMALLLSMRTLYTSPDDDNYLLNFAGQQIGDSGSLWSIIIEEPLWFMYAGTAGRVFGPELAFRLTIFLSTFLFLSAGNRLARGAWMFLLAVFVLNVALATLYYYIQIRIGVAISIFLFLAAVGFNPLLGAVVASLIHSSFLVVIPCVIVARLSAKSQGIWYGSVATMLMILGLIAAGVQFTSLFENIDLGRRSDTWQWGVTDNTRFYILAFLQFAVVFPVLKASLSDKTLRFWGCFAVVFFLSAVILSTINEAAGRYVAMSNIFIALLIGANIKSISGKMSAASALLILVAFLANEYAKGAVGFDSWFARWFLILA